MSSLLFSDSISAQAQPAGFVANPSPNAGQVFLACGPIAPANPSVVYRLFYSLTASAPANPLTATQYSFGTTAGDGGGTNAFGFNITGLSPGQGYTFWLYQFNTATSTYSTPAIATQNAGVAGPPPTPVGFVANTAGGSGLVFLACGPNQVGSNNIVYRLFYSPVATAPANPLSATQYTFGSTAGDGGGIAPFGFNISGLTPGTLYRFWLYQYNTSTMQYSASAATADQTSSGTSGPPATPTTNLPNPTCPSGNVINIYGGAYTTNIATDYNPNWGQSGFCCVNPNFDPGTGNLLLAYPSFNYQGTNLTATNASSMTYINFDIWTMANPATTTIQVSPINNGTGPNEILVTFPYTQGGWTRVSLPKSAFTGMTWNNVIQFKFAANGPNSLVPVDIYIDNLYFSSCAPANPTTNLANPTCASTNVINIYGGAYPTNIATNYNPNWGQSGFCCVNPNFNLGTGNPVMAYPTFNYQGTELTPTNAASMTYLNFDIWTNASPTATTIQVSPINFGTGTMETLVTVPYTSGQWTRVSLPKSAFTGMTWNDIRQLKFAANGPNSLNPVDIYLDNIYFSTCAPILPTPTTNLPNPTCASTSVINIYGGAYATNIATNYNPNWGQSGFCCVNPTFNPGTGNNVMEYKTFNYQGTELTPTNASSMTYLNFDIWTNASPSATTIQVSPINFGTGTMETLVTVPYNSGNWTRVSLPKSLFTGMTWNDVRQLKFAANGPNSLNPVDIYLDNIYFSTCAPSAPSTSPPNPTCAAGNVINIYSGTYPTTIATNYNPNWGQSGFCCVNPAYNPGTGNVALAYPNFNYQGTELIPTNASSMDYLHFDVWTNANPANTTLQVSPINFGTGTMETLVTVPYTSGQWTSVILPKSAFTGMTWNDIRQLKFAANGPNSLNPVDIYLDNIYFSNCVPTSPIAAAPVPTCAPANVISMFSNTYTNVGVDTWRTTWSQGNLADIQIGGNDTKLYTNLNFVGIETTGANLMNLTNMTFMHLDIWTPNMTTVRVKLVDFGANNAFGGGDDSEHEVVLNCNTLSGWNSFHIPLSGFANLKARNKIAQLILSGLPAGAGTLYVDNVYFTTCAASAPSVVAATISNTETSGTPNNASICPSSPVTLTASGGGTYSWSNGATTASISVTPAVTTTYTVTVTNAASCTATVSQTITVTPLPTAFTVTGGGTLCVGSTGVVVGLSGSSTGTSYQLRRDGINTGSPVNGTGAAISFGLQTIIGVYTVVATNTTSSCTGTMTGSVTITVDTQAPTLTCPANITANVSPLMCSAVVTYTAPVGTDNCPNAVTVQIAGLASGATYPVGITTNTFRVTDSNGASATCSFNVTVVDNIAPVIACPANITTIVDEATCKKLITYTAPVGTDNCPNPVTVQTSGIPSGALVGPGVYTNVFRVTDASGNSSTCSFTVTVGGGLPTITCPSTIVVNNDPGLCGAHVFYEATILDVFPPATITYSRPSGSFFGIGLSVVTATATNTCGSVSCSFAIFVNLGPDPELATSYTIIANNYVGLNGSTVSGGGVGTRTPNGVVQVQSGGKVTGPTTFVKSPDLYVSPGSIVDKYIDGVVNSAIIPPFLYSSGPTYNNITVPDNGMVTLSLSSYGDIKVGNNATVVFSGPSTVKVKQLITGTGSQISFNQNTSVQVKGIMTLGTNTLVNVGSGRFVTFYVDNNVTVREGCRVEANIFTLRLLIASGGASKTDMSGLFMGQQINSEFNVNWRNNPTGCQFGPGAGRPAHVENEDQGIMTIESRTNSEKVFKLYPNPAIDAVNIEYELEDANINHVFEVLDISGRVVASRTLSDQEQGQHQLSWQLDDIKNGIYMVVLRSGERIVQRTKLIIAN